MTIFSPGQRVEHKHHSSPRVFRETLVRFLCPDKFLAVVEDDWGKKYIVATHRLRPIGGCK